MLQQLHITNYAIIHQVSVTFTEGLNIITGETGAGKSVLIGAIALILGNRAEANTLTNPDVKCIIEGTFDNVSDTVQQLLNTYDIDGGNTIMLRREISPNGKSRAFINDTPVNLQQLKAIGNMLVDVHQQFDTQELGQENFQREVLDAIAGNTTILSNYKQTYLTYNSIKQQLTNLQALQVQALQTNDYNSFLYNELEEANLQPNAIEEAEVLLKQQSHTELIKATLSQAVQLLQQGEQPILNNLKQLQQTLKSISAYHTAMPTLLQRLQATYIELDDITTEMEQLNETIQYDEELAAKLADTINVGNRLLKKHHVTTTTALLEIKEKLALQLLQLNTNQAEIASLQIALATAEKKSLALANTLHQSRVTNAATLASSITKLLNQIGMPNAAIKIRLTQNDVLGEFGNSAISFLFDANNTNKYEPISKVASGGELSRLMLCIKNLVAGAMQLPVLIFDEIDTGISGEAAKQVGIVLTQLAQQHQILCITHQAQIAAKATTHYYIHKIVAGNTVSTSIKVLTKNERIITIAQLLSGEKPTEAALQNATEMITNL